MVLHAAILVLLIQTSALAIPCPLSVVQLLTFPVLLASDQQPVTSDHSEIRQLLPGVPIERELKGGEAHSYRIYLDQGQSLRVLATQQDETNLVIAALDPQQRTLTQVNALSGKNETETLTVVAESSGEYFITVRPADDKAPQGNYELLAESPGEATSSDRDCVAAQNAYWDARQLWREGTGASRRKAIPRAEEAWRLWHSLGEELWEGVTLHQLGLLYNELGEQQKALEYFQRALPLKQKAGARNSALGTLAFVCTALDSMGRFREGLDCWKSCLPASQELGKKGMEATVYMSLGLDYGVLGDKELGLENLFKALAMHREVGNAVGESLTLQDLGLLYDWYGEYQQALDYFEQALTIRRKLNDKRRLGVTLDNLAHMHLKLNDLEKAREYLQEALSLAREAGDAKNEIAVLANLAKIEVQQGEFEGALKLFQQAWAVYQRVGPLDLGARLLLSIGDLYLKMGDREKARETLLQALESSRQMGFRDIEIQTILVLGQVAFEAGEWGEARQRYEQALREARRLDSPILEAMALMALARTEFSQKSYEAARTHAEQALELTESLRARMTRERVRTGFLAGQQSLFLSYIDILQGLHQRQPSSGFDALALQVSEWSRARTLLDSLVETKASLRKGITPELLAQEHKLQQQINQKEQQRLQSLQRKDGQPQAEALNKEVLALLSEYESLQSKIRASSPRYAALTQPQPLTLKQIQQQVLDEDTLLLEYALGEERSFLWAVTPAALTSFALPKRAEIETAARRVYQLLIAQPGAQYPPEAIAFSQMLLGPVAEQLGNKRLLIVADGALQYIPFAALPEPRPKTQDPRPKTQDPRPKTFPTNGRRPATGDRPLVMNHEVVRLPSASVLAVLRQELVGRQPAPEMVAVLADPVFQTDDPRIKPNHATMPKTAGEAPEPPSDVERSAKELGLSGFKRLAYTRREAEAITDLVPAKARLKALDFTASKTTALSEALSRYRIVHFATHGLLNSAHPELSGIVLSLVNQRGEPQDGFLRAHEVYNLNLPAELVVLSGCKTGLGKEIRGEGLVGLTRGFMYAGAPRVVVSLWNVSDAGTAELMKRFYQAMLKEGLKPAAALREAQVSMWKEKRWRAPYYWAGFVFQGEWK